MTLPDYNDIKDARGTKRIVTIDRCGYTSLLTDAYDNRFPAKRALAEAIVNAFRRGEEVVVGDVHFVLAGGI